MVILQKGYFEDKSNSEQIPTIKLLEGGKQLEQLRQTNILLQQKPGHEAGELIFHWIF